MNHLIVLTLFMVSTVDLISSYPGLVFASHEEKQKSDSDSNNQPDTTTTSDKQTDSTTTDVIPIPAEPPQCDSSNTNPTCVAATNELIKEQTELEKQRILIAQQQQEQNEISLENQRVIDNINAAQSQDTSSSDNSGSSGSGGSSSTSSDDEQSTSEDKNLFFTENHDKNLSADSKFILMPQDGKIALFSIILDKSIR